MLYLAEKAHTGIHKMSTSRHKLPACNRYPHKQHVTPPKSILFSAKTTFVLKRDKNNIYYIKYLLVKTQDYIQFIHIHHKDGLKALTTAHTFDTAPIW